MGRSFLLRSFLNWHREGVGVGHRGNLFLVEHGQVLHGRTKDTALTLNVPGFVARGETYVADWLKRQGLHPDPQRDFWDEIFTEAALMVNVDERELVLGFWQWIPLYPPEP